MPKAEELKSLYAKKNHRPDFRIYPGTVSILHRNGSKGEFTPRKQDYYNTYELINVITKDVVSERRNMTMSIDA